MTAEPQTSESTEQRDTDQTQHEQQQGQPVPGRAENPDSHENEEETATEGETSAAANLPWDPTDPSIPRTGPREMDVQKKGFGDEVLT